MVFTQINYNGKTIYPYQIVNKKFYFKSNGKIYNFPYRLSDEENIRVEDDTLIVDKYAVADADYENVILYDRFIVNGEELVITL